MNFWKRKLAAYLHDPPSKALDIRTHGERSDSAFYRAGFADSEVGEYFAFADHTGAAADRLPFPQSRAAGLQCAFDGVRSAFRHPFGGATLPFHGEFKSAEQGIEGEESVQPVLTAESLQVFADENLRWRARFFAHWRLWPKHAALRDYRLALLPADTRIPDHSIWTHMQVVSALDGCVGENKIWQPAFLKFQLGPVQDFIAAARSTRDLWSGSYLLSWLMAAGLKALSAEAGPDAVIFPNLKGQPVFDLHWRTELWSQVKIGSNNVWESLGWKNQELLTPNLPNVFLAVVAADQASALAETVCKAIRAEWQRIAGFVWDACEKGGLTEEERNDKGEPVITTEERKTRFDSQIQRFLSLSWQATAWPQSLEEALGLAEQFNKNMPIQQARHRVDAVVKMATKNMPFDHRDRRFYTDDSKTKLNNVGLGWSVIVAFNGWSLDAVRRTRNFDAAHTGGWETGVFKNKDALTGRDEAVAGGKEWLERSESRGGFWPSLFKKADWIGAATLVKRLWHQAYLIPVWRFRSDDFRMPNTRGLAAHDPLATDKRFNDEDDSALVEDLPASDKYFAVLALDGDAIGKWISGERNPPIQKLLADYRDYDGTLRQGSLEYFQRDSNPDAKTLLKDCYAQFLESPRPLSPSYHLQFSEALSNFALFCVQPIVESFDGRLVYAGGDDVLALLPADTVLACSQALVMAFTGKPALREFLRTHAGQLRARHQTQQRADAAAPPTPYYQGLAAEGCLLDCVSEGFLRRLDLVDDQNRAIPFLVPGPEAGASAGIAIAHFKAPLQDVVRAAQAAERRAKNPRLNRSAVAVTLLKRSGEIIEWGCRWGTGGLQLFQAVLERLSSGDLSAKFPHRVIELLEPYLLSKSGLFSMQGAGKFQDVEVIRREFEHALLRQTELRGTEHQAMASHLSENLSAYLASLPEDRDRRIQDLIGLCQTVAFAHRTRN